MMASHSFEGFWIGHPAYNGECLHFHREFYVKKEIIKAELFITGLGFFVSWVNGTRTDEYYDKPLISEYDDRALDRVPGKISVPTGRRIYYHRFEVSSFLKPGVNHIDVLLGSGWYSNTEKEEEGNFFYDAPKMIFDLCIHYSDGTRGIIKSDGETLVRCSGIVSKLYSGECWINKEGKFFPSVRARTPAGTLMETFDCCDVVAEELAPARIFSIAGSRSFTADFGKNHTGTVVFRAKGKKGSRVRVTYGENCYPDGKVNHISTSWNVQVQIDEVVLSHDGEVVFRPFFACHGYRFAQFDLEGDVTIDSIISRYIHADIKKFSSFSCGDDLLNKLFLAYRNTQLANMHGGIPSDCPHREKRGYTGDGQVTARSCLYTMEASEFYRKWLEDILDAQDLSDGYVPNTAPFSGGGGGGGWGHAVTVIPRVLFEFTGDKNVLIRSANGVRRWIDYLKTQQSGDFLIDCTGKNWFLGEWFCPQPVELDVSYVNTCFFAESLKNAAFIFENIDDPCMSEKYSALRANVVESIRRRFYDPETGSYAGGKQGGDIMAVAFGIASEKELPRLLENIRNYYSEGTGYHLDTGIYGTPLLLEVLTENNMRDIAVQIMRKTDFPSYGNMLKGDDLTLWECWDHDYSPDFRTGDNGEWNRGYPVSLNHPMFGSVTAWLFEHVLGISCRDLWRRRIKFEPRFIDYIDHASGTVETRFGRISFSYERKADGIEFKTEIPKGFEGICNGKLLKSGHCEWSRPVL